MERLCPDCVVALVGEDFEGIKIDYCPQCAGIWFDEGELIELRRQCPTTLKELDEEVTPEVQSSEKREGVPHCPACKIPLYRYRYAYTSPIVLDACKKCGGIWFDNGELIDMVEFWRQEKEPPVSPEEKKKLLLAIYGMESETNRYRAEQRRRLFRTLAMRISRILPPLPEPGYFRDL